MLELKTHQDIDQLVWSCISESTNPLDFLDYIRHVRNRFAQQEQAFESAERYQGQTDAPRMFGQAVAALTELAGQGDANASSTWGAGTDWAMAWRPTLIAVSAGTAEERKQAPRHAWSI